MENPWTNVKLLTKLPRVFGYEPLALGSSCPSTKGRGKICVRKFSLVPDMYTGETVRTYIHLSLNSGFECNLDDSGDSREQGQ